MLGRPQGTHCKSGCDLKHENYYYYYYTESKNCHKQSNIGGQRQLCYSQEQLLKESKLTPREYRSKFMDAKKTAEETYTMFTARLKNLLNYYVKSKQVNDNY